MKRGEKPIPEKQDESPNSDNIEEEIVGLAAKVNPLNKINEDGDLIGLKKDRSQLYNSILSDYQKSIRCTLRSKNVYKAITFGVSILILLFITITMVVMVLKYGSYERIAWLQIIIPLLVSFLTVFIVIPQIITNYLFDKNEEAHMTDLLKALIDYDIKMR